MKIYHYPKCSTCREALRFLREQGLEFEDFDISIEPPTTIQLYQMLESYEGDIKRLFNVSGARYRELQLKDKLSKMTVAAAIDLLAAEGMLIKRPFLISDDVGLIGFKKEEWRKKFSNYFILSVFQSKPKVPF